MKPGKRGRPPILQNSVKIDIRIEQTTKDILDEETYRRSKPGHPVLLCQLIRQILDKESQEIRKKHDRLEANAA